MIMRRAISVSDEYFTFSFEATKRKIKRQARGARKRKLFIRKSGTAQKQMNGKGPGILSFELSSPEGARKLPQLLEIVEHATSLGGVESCIDYRFQWDKNTAPTLLRLSIGLESPKDLIADLKTALLKL
ncbi:hypothetical protein C9374_001926 [Naegleria lovaniensis]|uniref:Cystathionine gamma-synthase n=1 Tax=Naegleria lovaniensis TaxID=51637 RepID=A0AA88KMU9_NAELO|nr:uncharacterized protein C9374_001926 [Naegleria lovaniensis]KAG2386891.1 hypothetical protein C9374_001926 [Naegleria lovaniensis]